MHVVQVVVDDGTQRLGFVVARHLATGSTYAGHRGAQRGTRTTEVKAHFVELVEGLLDVFGLDALEHDVAGLAMEGDQAGTTGCRPDVAHLAQQVRGVVHAGGRLDTQGVEFGRLGEQRIVVFVLQLGETGDHAAAVAEHANGTALPVAELGLVRGFQLTHQVNHHVVFLGQALEAGHEAGPRAFFELVQIRGVVHLLRHFVSPRTFRNARSAGSSTVSHHGIGLLRPSPSFSWVNHVLPLGRYAPTQKE